MSNNNLEILSRAIRDEVSPMIRRDLDILKSKLKELLKDTPYSYSKFGDMALQVIINENTSVHFDKFTDMFISQYEAHLLQQMTKLVLQQVAKGAAQKVLDEFKGEKQAEIGTSYH